MILECPNCATRYEMSTVLPDEGRKVRCARCSHIWHATPDQALSEDVEDSHNLQQDELEHSEFEQEEFEEAVDEADHFDLQENSETEQDDDLDIDIIPPIKPDAPDNSELEFRDTEDLSDDNENNDIDMEDWGGANIEDEASADTSTLDDLEITEPAAETIDAPVIEHNTFEDASFSNISPAETEDVFEENTVETKDSDFMQEAENPVEIKGLPPISEEPAVNMRPPPQNNRPNFSQAPLHHAKPVQDTTKSLYRIASGWAILGLVVISFFSMIYFYRISIVQALPGAVHVYSAAGINVNIRSLEFKSVAYKPSTNAGQPSIKVSGVIENISDRNVKIPTVVFIFMDDDGAELYHLARRVDSEILPARRRLNFNFHLQVPPVEAKTLEVRFAKKSHL